MPSVIPPCSDRDAQKCTLWHSLIFLLHCIGLTRKLRFKFLQTACAAFINIKETSRLKISNGEWTRHLQARNAIIQTPMQ
jgi:hypothetical protein